MSSVDWSSSDAGGQTCKAGGPHTHCYLEKVCSLTEIVAGPFTTLDVSVAVHTKGILSFIQSLALGGIALPLSPRIRKTSATELHGALCMIGTYQTKPRIAGHSDPDMFMVRVTLYWLLQNHAAVIGAEGGHL